MNLNNISFVYKIDLGSVYSKKLFDAGLIKIGNLYDENGEFKLDKEPWRSSLSPVDHFLFFRLLNAFPQEWRKELKLNRASIYGNTQRQNLSSFTLYVDGKKKSLEKLSSKSLYQIFVSKISCKPTAMKKYDKAFNTDTSHLDWEKIYLLPFKTTLHTKLREFQYKILNRILYTNVVVWSSIDLLSLRRCYTRQFLLQLISQFCCDTTCALRYMLLESCYTGQRFSVILEAVVSSAAILS